MHKSSSPSLSSSSPFPSLQQQDMGAYMMQSRKLKAPPADEVDEAVTISDNGDIREDNGNFNDSPTEPISKRRSLLPSSESKTLAKSHFVISICTHHVESILTGTKTYEFRKYPLPAKDMWIYEAAPVSAVRYYAVISAPYCPGEIPESDLHIERNRQFNDGLLGTLVPDKGRKKSRKEANWYAHKVLEVWKLKETISLGAPVEKGWVGSTAEIRLA